MTTVLAIYVVGELTFCVSELACRRVLHPNTSLETRMLANAQRDGRPAAYM